MEPLADADVVYGVDFSASKRDAGRNTWIAECSPAEDGLVVEGLADAATVLDCDPGREATLEALVDLIEADGDGRRAFGLDFPFGLPRDLMGEGDWHTFVSGVRDGDGWGALGAVDGPRALYEHARARAEGGDVDLLRRTDAERGGQEPTGFRIKTQTYHGISGVLAPVAANEDVSVVPMDDGVPETVVLETYPAAAFRRLRDDLGRGVHDRGYKRDTRDAIERRRANVDGLAGAGVQFGEDETFAVASDHALDAVAAAYAAWRATRAGGHPGCLVDGAGEIPEPYRREGYIFR